MDQSSNLPNGSGNDLSWSSLLGRGGQQNPLTPASQASSSSPTDVFAVGLSLGVNPPSRTPEPEVEIDPPSSILTNAPPIHSCPMTINPQSSSALCNGRIPPEIREQIFKYSLTEYTQSDKDSQYPDSTDYTRPGYTGKRAVAISLLLTCRKVYLETYYLPAQNKEHIFWHERWPPTQERYTISPKGQEADYFERFRPWQLELVKDVHLFTQLFWLEDGSFFRLTKEDFMQGISKLKITIRRGDWWWNERNAELGIIPQRGNGDAVLMLRDWEDERRGHLIEWKRDGWGCAFGNLGALQELEMEFETSEDKIAELGKIVEKAKTWRFPLKDGKVLSTEGIEAKERTWRAPLCYWSLRCPYCHGRANCYGMNAPCVEKRRLRGLGLGPQCTVVSLRWRVANATA